MKTNFLGKSPQQKGFGPMSVKTGEKAWNYLEDDLEEVCFAMEDDELFGINPKGGNQKIDTRG